MGLSDRYFQYCQLCELLRLVAVIVHFGPQGCQLLFDPSIFASAMLYLLQNGGRCWSYPLQDLLLYDHL